LICAFDDFAGHLALEDRQRKREFERRRLSMPSKWQTRPESTKYTFGLLINRLPRFSKKGGTNKLAR